jgi:hypothetical protein
MIVHINFLRFANTSSNLECEKLVANEIYAHHDTRVTDHMVGAQSDASISLARGQCDSVFKRIIHFLGTWKIGSLKNVEIGHEHLNNKNYVIGELFKNLSWI